MIRRAQFGIAVPDSDRSTFDLRQSKVFAGFAAVQADPSVSIYYPHLSFCDRLKCKIAVDGMPIYSDWDHLNEFGARMIAGPIGDLILKQIPPPD